ncbi:glutathione binding-like protein [Chromatiaceae bacterium AAb-1]|nr:glutathione binding-like protein [Chromatiaceae bacterium AAb-1]
MIDLYYFPTPNGHKITIFLEEAALEYQIIPVDIRSGDQFKPAFLAISPNNKMPAIVDHQGPDNQAISVFESGAILQYLAEKTGQFFGKNATNRIQVLEWLNWQVAGFGPMLGQNHHFNQYAPEPIPYAIERYTTETRRLYKVLNEQLAKQDYLAGDYSIADMAAFPWALGAEKQKVELATIPHVVAWIDRIKARPAVQKALALAEKFNPAPITDEQKKILFGNKR